MKMQAQAVIGGGVVVLAGLMAAGASQIQGEAGYAGFGPAFMPWLVSAVLALCGVMLIIEAMRAPPSGDAAIAPADAPSPSATANAAAAGPADLASVAWVSAGLLLNAALINRLGFVVSCALLFALAARGFRQAMGWPCGLQRLGRDALIGLAISAPVYWLFTKGLGLTLPGLTKTGWI